MVLHTQIAPAIVIAPITWSSHLSTRGLFNLVVMAQAAQFPSMFFNLGVENHLSNKWVAFMMIFLTSMFYTGIESPQHTFKPRAFGKYLQLQVSLPFASS